MTRVNEMDNSFKQFFINPPQNVRVTQILAYISEETAPGRTSILTKHVTDKLFCTFNLSYALTGLRFHILAFDGDNFVAEYHGDAGGLQLLDIIKLRLAQH